MQEEPEAAEKRESTENKAFSEQQQTTCAGINYNGRRLLITETLFPGL